MYEHPRRGHATTITARPRRAFEACVVMALTLTLFAVPLFARGSDSTSIETRTVRVQAGDTLWSLASRHPVAGRTTAQTARLLADLNDVDADSLSAGTVVRVPVSETDIDRGALAMR